MPRTYSLQAATLSESYTSGGIKVLHSLRSQEPAWRHRSRRSTRTE